MTLETGASLMENLIEGLADVPYLDSAIESRSIRHNVIKRLSNIPKIIWARREKTCFRGFANNTGADQPAHPRSLISAFVFRFLESIISRLATSENRMFSRSL